LHSVGGGVGENLDEAAGMNLPYAYAPLIAATEQRHGFIKLFGKDADQEVRQMVEAGLVEATLNDGQEGSFTSINRVLEAGHSFLRALKDPALLKEPLPGSIRTPSQTALLEKWTKRLV
jgi:hypothetical protein